MKNTILFLFLIFSLNAGEQITCPLYSVGNTAKYPDTVGTLRTYYANQGCFSYTCGKTTKYDGLGGAYTFDTTSTLADDGYKVLQPGYGLPCALVKGRWIRVNQSVTQYPQGTLYVLPGGYKKFIGQFTTTSTGNTVTVNLTTDNTSTGTALFTNTLLKGDANVAASSLPTGYTAAQSGDAAFGTGNKTASFTFIYSNVVNVSLIGLNVASIGTMSAGAVVTFSIEGN